MAKAKKHTAADKPVTQQRDERGAGVVPEEQQLGNTVRDRRRAPKMPHERDETPPDAASANEAAQPGNEVMRRAYDDAVSGKQDTDRLPVMDKTYHRLRKK